MIDSHAHLYFDRFDADRERVIERAVLAGVEQIINIGIDVPTSELAVAAARERPGLFAAVGIHPTSPIDDVTAVVEQVALLAEARDFVVAIGEIGLDYYWKDVPPEAQKAKLSAQLDLALTCQLPVIFHCREALDDLFAVLEGRAELPPGVFHCFSGGEAEASRALELGFHVSFAGNVTYPKAKALQAAARVVPSDRLLLETDAPFLAPQARRGKRNEPSYVAHTCAFLEELKGLDPGTLAPQTTATTRALFGLPASPHLSTTATG